MGAEPRGSRIVRNEWDGAGNCTAAPQYPVASPAWLDRNRSPATLKNKPLPSRHLTPAHSDSTPFTCYLSE